MKHLHPIEDMEIEFDADEDTIDIKELVDAKQKVQDELVKPKLKELSGA